MNAFNRLSIFIRARIRFSCIQHLQTETLRLAFKLVRVLEHSVCQSVAIISSKIVFQVRALKRLVTYIWHILLHRAKHAHLVVLASDSSIVHEVRRGCRTNLHFVPTHLELTLARTLVVPLLLEDCIGRGRQLDPTHHCKLIVWVSVEVDMCHVVFSRYYFVLCHSFFVLL